MTLRSLSDLELAALVSSLHMALLSATAVQGSVEQQRVASPWPIVEVLFAAANVAGAEVIARRAGDACAERLFPGFPALPVSDARFLRELIPAIARKLRGHDFASVARLLEERVVAEVRVDAMDSTFPAGVELRPH